MQESRHHIKTRMLKNAARAWGYPETEAESNFDPLVTMLLSACSVELEKISGEIQASRARILERLVQLLSPDVLTGALPAHAIATASPVEGNTELPADAQFYIHHRLSSLNETEEPQWKDLFFTPTASFRLHRAAIRFMAVGNQLYRMNATGGKEMVAHSDAGRELPPSTLWLGIDEPPANLHDSLFYFELRNQADRSLFFHQLPKATWHTDNNTLKHLPGYGLREISGESLDLSGILNGNNDVLGKIKKHINAYYKHAFITLLDERGATIRNDRNTTLPHFISQVFCGKEEKILQQQPLRWITVKFPEIISNRMLQDVTCVMNCFPVMNRRLHEVHHRLQEMINIVPLQTDDLFLDLEEISDEEGRMLNLRSVQEEENFVVLMRNGGIGRFDERDAASLVDDLLQLLRDDSAAFSSLDNDFVSSEVRQLQQSMNKLEQRLFSVAPHRQQFPYLMIQNKEKKSGQNLFMRYWTTSGKAANHLKAGTSLQLYKGGALENNTALLITTTQGGRNKLGPTESLLAYKSALLSKDRLVTQEDVKAFCAYQLGERAGQIEIRKGVMIHPDPQQGYTRTVDVLISISKKAYEQMEANGERIFWQDNLQLLLKEKSTALTPYRVFIQQAA
jgi:hypothetical protein